MAMVVRCIVLGIVMINAVGACKAEKPVERERKESVVILKPRRQVLTAEQRDALGFPSEVISEVEQAAGQEAEPFYMTVVKHTENLKGDPGFESRKLAGFSVHAVNADDLQGKLRARLRQRGFLLFKSQRGYGQLHDVVTVIRGNSSYDILKIQRTEAQNYHISTGAIIAWLKARQREGSFFVTGAGADWLEARFVRPPADSMDFARKIIAFSPDILVHGPRSAERLAERIKRENRFSLVWD